MKRMAMWLAPLLASAALGGCSGKVEEGVPKDAQAAAPGSFPGTNKAMLIPPNRVPHRGPQPR